MHEIRDLRRDVMTGLILGFILTLALFLPVLPSWNSVYTGVALHSLLALLAIIAAAWVYVDIRGVLPTYETIIFAALVSRGIIHLGAAMTISLTEPGPTVAMTMQAYASDALEITILGVLLLLAVLSHRQNQDGKTTRTWAIALILAALAVDGLFFHVIFPGLSDLQLQLVGTAAGLLAAASLVLAGWFRTRPPFKEGDRETSLIVIGFTLFMAASIPAIMPLFIAEFLWALAMVFQGVAFLAFTLAVATPRLMTLGMNYETSFGVPGVLSLLAFVPFMVSIFTVSIVPDFFAVDLGAYYISHTGAAFLSAIMAYLVYEYSKRKPAWVHYPLILLFLSWALIEGYIVLLWRGEDLAVLGESVVPYIVGSLVSILALAGGIYWTEKPPSHEVMKRPWVWISTRLAIVMVVLVGGQFLEVVILSGNPQLVGSPLGRVVLLGANFVAMFAFTYLTFLLARKRGSWRTIEGLAVGFLAVWIVPNVLKGNFDDWVAGWWAAEVFLLIGLLIGPALIGALYLQEMFRAEESRRRATLYSDILVHDVSNLHQALALALGLLDIDDIPREVRGDALEDARSCLRRADQLVKNVRGLGFADTEDEISLERIDLVRSVEQAFGQLVMEKPDATVEFSVTKSTGKCYVLANSLLMDLFYNLFKNSVMYSPDQKRIEVDIEMVSTEEESWWQTRVVDYGRGIEPERKDDLFRRFMRGAEGSGLGLSVVYALARTYGGTVTVEDRVPGDYSKGTVFVVTIPAYVQDDKEV